jgi:hypothetical protein
MTSRLNVGTPDSPSFTRRKDGSGGSGGAPGMRGGAGEHSDAEEWVAARSLGVGSWQGRGASAGG